MPLKSPRQILAFLSLKCQVLVAVEVLLAKAATSSSVRIKQFYRLILLLLIYFALQLQ
jgi:hypothetical protein